MGRGGQRLAFVAHSFGDLGEVAVLEPWVGEDGDDRDIPLEALDIVGQILSDFDGERGYLLDGLALAQQVQVFEH